MLLFTCPGCGRKLRAPLHLAARTIRCPQCQGALVVPDAQPNSEQATLARPPDPDATLAPPSASAASAAPAGATMPGYEILGELGRGGMGVVYKARQARLNRVVALKMILAAGHAGEEERARFRAEAEAIARLQHPNIVQVFEVGEHDGCPFFSLEFCDGGSLEKRLAGTPLPPRETAALVETLARAMQAAHDKGVIHRDLKPANVLLVGQAFQPDSSADVRLESLTYKITDFGLAKKLDEVGRTQSGSILGTPSYMAPEQAGGKGKQIGPPADVYALGAILYECLTGRPPFKAATPLDTILQVISDEPVPPRRLNPQAPRDLETICLKCLQKEPRLRYASAAALADDLRAYLDDRPVAARPTGRLTHAWRWCKRNRAVAALLTLVAVALVAGTVVSSLFAVEASRGRRDAEENARQARQQATRAEQGERLAAETLYAANINLAHREWQADNNFRARNLLDSLRDRDGWEWGYLDRLFRGERFSLRGHQGHLVDLAIGPRGDRVVTAGADRTTRLWDVRTGSELTALSPWAVCLAFSSDGRLAGAADDAVQVWDAETGRPVRNPIPLSGRPCGLDYVGGGRLGVVTMAGDVLFFDPDSGAEVARCPKPLRLDRATEALRSRGHQVVFSPDGRLVAQGGADCKVRVWDTATGELVLEGTGHLMLVGQVAFSPDGKRLASPGGEGTIRIWDLATKRVVRHLRGHRAYVHAVAFSPDGKRLVSGSKDTTARVWDVESGESLLTLSGHLSEVWGVRFSRDGQLVYTHGPDSQIKVWEAGQRVFASASNQAFFRDNALPSFDAAGSRGAWTYYGHIGPNHGVALSPDGRLAATGAAVEAKLLSEVRLWDLDRRREVGGLPVPANRQCRVAFSPDGKLVAVGVGAAGRTDLGEVRLFEVGGRQLRTLPGGRGNKARPAFSPDGRHVACAFSGDGMASTLTVHDVASGAELYRQTRGTGLLAPAYLDADTLVTAVLIDGMVRLLDARTGTVRKSWKAGEVNVTAVAVGPNGRIATADTEGPNATIRFWDAAGEHQLAMEGHVGVITSLAFSPDGMRLASCASDFTVKVWHTGMGRELLTFREHRDVPHQVAWSGDGSRLASVGQDGALKVWEGGAAGLPNTDGWQRLYRDDFDRDVLGDSWEPVAGSQLSVRDGALRGRLVAFQGQNARFHQAQARLRGVELPRTVEVRFTARVSQPMLVSPVLSDTQTGRLLIPFVTGVPRPFGYRGAAAVLMSADSTRGAMIGMPRGFDLRPGVEHQFRLVRTPQRLWLFVDGREAVAADLPPIEAPELRLQGAWSQAANCEVAFSRVEVRAPAAAVRERRLRELADRHFDRLGIHTAAREAVDAEPGLSAEERAVARARLAERRELPQSLLKASLGRSAQKNATAAERRLALSQAQRASRLVLGGEKFPERVPRASLYLTAVGLARLRAGQPKEALAELTRAVEVRRAQKGAAVLRQVAALALAARQLGQAGQAAAYRQQMRDLRRGASDDELREAAPWVAAVDAQIAGGGDAERDALLAAFIEIEEAGWLRRDLRGYLAGRTDDCREVTGRTATPDEHDVTLDRAGLTRKRPWDFREVDAAWLRVRRENVRIERHGETATLRQESTVQGGDWWRTWASEARLRREAGRWKIAYIRSWPVRGLDGGRAVKLDDAWWQDRDARAARAEGPAKAQALHDALRSADTLALLRQSEPTTAEAWTLRGRAALDVGDMDEVRAAYLAAEKIDPQQVLHPALTAPITELAGAREGNYSVAYTPGGELLAGGVDGVLRRWDAAGKLLRQDRHPEAGVPLAAVAVTADGKRIATARHQVWLWPADTMASPKPFGGHVRHIYRLAFSPDGTRLVSASADHRAIVRDVAGGQPVELRGHAADVLGAVFSPDGKRVATASHDGTARLWDAATGKQIRVFSGHSGKVIRVAFAPDGATLATCGEEGEIKLWDVSTGKEVRNLSGPRGVVEVVAYSPDGALLAAAGDGGAVYLFETRTWRLRRVLRGHTGRVYSLAFRADGKRLAAAAGEPTVRVWEVPTAP